MKKNENKRQKSIVTAGQHRINPLRENDASDRSTSKFVGYSKREC